MILDPIKLAYILSIAMLVVCSVARIYKKSITSVIYNIFTIMSLIAYQHLGPEYAMLVIVVGLIISTSRAILQPNSDKIIRTS